MCSSPWRGRSGGNKLLSQAEREFICLRRFYPNASTPCPAPCLSAHILAAPAHWKTPSPLSLCQPFPFPSSHTLAAFLLHSQGFCRVVCSGIAWSTSGILGLWLALLQSQSNEVAPSLCRRVTALAMLKPSPVTDLK